MALLEKLRWRLRMLWAALTVKPVAGGAPDDDADDSSDDDAGGEDDDADDDDSDDEDETGKGKDADDSSDDDDDEEDEHKKPSFLRRAARKHERTAKREKKRADRLQRELDRAKGKGKGTGKSGEDEADDDASAEKAEVERERSDLQSERRSFRLEQAVTRMARKGIKLGDGKDAKTVKFADPEDALVHIERGIERGDIDADDIFDSEGKVQSTALTEALVELAEDKDHLLAKQQSRRPSGSSDAGKGSGGGKGIEDKTVEDHLKDVQRK